MKFANGKIAMAGAIAIAMAHALAGCSGAPGDAEVRQAIKNRIVALHLGPSNPKGEKEFDAELAKIKSAVCQKAEDKSGFNCDWSGGEAFALLAPNSGRIVKGESGWMLAAAGR